MDLIWKFQGPAGEVSQGVRISAIDVHKEPWLFVVADIAPETAMSLRQVIGYQDHIGFGAVIIRKGTLLLRHSLPLPRLSMEDVERALRMVAGEAGRLRVTLASKKPDAPPAPPGNPYDD